jgi:hypothetical protein
MHFPIAPHIPFDRAMMTSPFPYFWKACLAGLILMTLTTRESVAAPEISITGGSGAFGSVLVGNQPTQTITINNTGSSPLNVSGISLSGAGFAFVTAPTLPAAVAITNGTLSFQVRFSPTARHAYSGTLTIASNDADEASVVVNLSGTGVAPEIDVPVTSVAFGNVSLVATPPTQTITINNIGDAVLNVSAITVSGAGFSIVAPAPTTPLALASTTGTQSFQIRFTPTLRQPYSGSLTLTSDDADEGSIVIPLSGTGVAPEISVEQPENTALSSLSPSYDGEKSFGDVVVGANSKLTFTIKNTGNAPLTGVVITPVTSGDFSLVSPPLASVAAGSSATFAIDFFPSATGTRSAVFSIANNDPDGDESPFVLSLTGNGVTPPSDEDGFGYRYASAPVTAVKLDPLDPNVVNASALTGDDLYMAINIGFTFYFYDKAYTTCSASTNGLLMFGSPTTDYTPDVPLPNTNAPNNIIAPFWVDLFRSDTASKILYTTRGSAPNRVFIIDYQDMEEYANASGKASFQVQLFEGNNAIEFQFKGYSGFKKNPDGSYVRPVGIGIENAMGSDGLSIAVPTTFPSAIRITRRSIVTVESKYAHPYQGMTDIGDLARGLDPEIGTTREPYGSLMRFEAPPYIYLDKGFAILNGAGDVNGPPEQVAWYRLANRGYSVDGQPIQGTDAFVELSLTQDIKLVWRWELEFAVNIKFAGVGTPSPEVGRTWYPLNAPLTGSVETLVNNDSSGIRLQTTGYKLTKYGPLGPLAPETFDVEIVGTRAVTAPFTVTAPMELEWLGSRQVRYRFRATASTPGQSDTPFSGLPFVRVYDLVGTGSVTTYGVNNPTDVWINSDTGKIPKVEVGAFYRTEDNSFTLSDFPVPPGGDIAALGDDISLMADSQRPVSNAMGAANRLARTYVLNDVAQVNRTAPTPTEINWNYQPTVFRAEVPVGMAFDPTQTVPRMSEGLIIRILSDLGPDESSYNPVGDVLTGTKSPGGKALRWDKVDLKLYPVHPDTQNLKWKDKNDPTKIYSIQIVSGYPGETVNLTTARENLQGERQGTAPNYVTQTTLPTIMVTNPGVGFPARADNAHYRHLFDPSTDRNPPTKLDISVTDEWKFQELVYSDRDTDATASALTSGAPFVSRAAGRSVALFSYRPNPDEIADGNLNREKLAVRVIRSVPITPVFADDSKLVLGRRGLELGGGTAANRGAFGLVRASGSSTVSPGTNFVVDFWLNAKGVEDIPVVLTNCVTNGTTTVTCPSTVGLVAGMTVSGANIATGTRIQAITNSTTFVLSEAATGSGEALTLTAAGKPITILTTRGGNLKIVLDPVASTITATYFGTDIVKLYPTSGAAWRHHVLHVFANQVSNGPQATVLNYYVDGVRDEVGFVTTTKKSLTDTAGFDVTTTLSANSLRFGVDADPASRMQMDQFRLFSLPDVAPENPWLTATDVQNLRTLKNIGSSLRSLPPLLWFSFDLRPNGGTTDPTTNPLGNSGSLADVTIGPVTPDETNVYPGTLARVDIQEVATRLESTLDNAGFSGSGYVLNSKTNYNAGIYNRSSEIGLWGPIFPVNDNQLFTEAAKLLEVAYYENPYRTDRSAHPNVAWPYQAAIYSEVKYPTFGLHKDKAIYIASRIGSEGVDKAGRVQQPFDLAKYANLTIYNQPDITQAGYNPNEEHALVAPSGRAALKLKNAGEDIANNPPLAAFALQADLNAKSPSFSSDPWALVQVNNLVTGEPEMAAYEVIKTRDGSLDFPRPSDSTVASTPGLDYESATTPEERFLITDKSKTFDFKYEFTYTAFAGDLLIPPYPLNLVIGNVAMADARGNSIQVNGVNQRTLWRDVNKNAWVVSGNGQFFHQFFYPLRGDFYPPDSKPIGTPVAWVPDSDSGFTGVGSTLNPVKVIYDTFWRSNYPKLKRGETLTYQGGEYFSETPGAVGLPSLVSMKAAEIVYDSSIRSMVIGNTASPDDYPLEDATARIIRPLDRREKPFTVANMGVSGFTPAASTKVFIVAERWYFKELPGSLQKRFYFDSLAQQLVFRGYLNDKDSGNKDLTVGPDPLNILETNVITPEDHTRIRNLSTIKVWTDIVDEMFLLSQNPHGVTGANSDATADIKNLQGVKNKPTNYPAELTEFWESDLQAKATSPTPTLVPLDSFGVGSALVPNANLLTKAPEGSLYVTIAENNRPELAGAPVSLHIIEIIPARYRGAIKVIEAADAFSEKVSLQHNGEFGGNTGELYYEWWIRDASSLDEVAQEVLANGTLKEFDTSGNSLWQQYLPKERLENNDLVGDAKHYGLNSIVFEGRPDVVLADKLVLMRYRHRDEKNWTLVPFEVANPVTAWKPGTSPPVSAAPFQWAGAANSPQLQADGSKRYVPQLVMGWVKRVLDRINPYEARYTDFFSNESPATYTSQIQIAGAPYAGAVALNPDKNVIENTGLIELYMTVLNRARALSIDNATAGPASDGIKQALLLAATRLSVLYELLASEAYSDAQDSTINTGDDASLLSVASYTHAFQNIEANLMHEELALLRGTDFQKSYPVYNRMFWNYAKGLGEAAYNVNYNIYDVDTDGFINENDARKLYPQGHGDAWGHFMSAIGMHYTLLQHPGFSWRTRSELYSLMQNVLEVDYLDEKSFAKLAAAKARTGRDIVRGTYRMNYTQDPDGQWQGYTDGADPARAWGVSEWGHRAGQAAWFDFAVANALLPAEATGANPENLDLLERSAAIDDIGEIVGGLHEIQVALDEANGGVNPLGLDSDALTFDIDLQFYDNSSGGDRRSHFEQVFVLAAEAGANAMTALEYATQAGNKLRSIGDDTNDQIISAFQQDLDFRNRLIEIFGRPYHGTIGFGKAYPEGYEGPDTLLFAYLDRTTIDQIIPPKKPTNTGGPGASGSQWVDYTTIEAKWAKPIIFPADGTLSRLYPSAGLAQSDFDQAFRVFLQGATSVGGTGNSYLNYSDAKVTLPLPVRRASQYAFQVDPTHGWGQRTSYGRVQQLLERMLLEEVALQNATSTYVGFLGDLDSLLTQLHQELERAKKKEEKGNTIDAVRKTINSLILIQKAIQLIAENAVSTVTEIQGISEKALPSVIGFSNDIFAPVKAAGYSIGTVGKIVAWLTGNAANIAVMAAELTRDEVISDLQRDIGQIDQIKEIEGIMEAIENLSGSDGPMRADIGAALQQLEITRQEYVSAQAEGFRLLREREAYNKNLAAQVQRNRYQDMILRLSRNESMSKYQSTYNNAARYAWLAARAYDYETSLDTGHPAAPGTLLDKIVKERQLGLWVDGSPKVGNGGLAEILAQLSVNFSALKHHLGIGNPQPETGKISLRSELFRIRSYDQEVFDAFDTPQNDRTAKQVALVEENPGAPASRSRWQDALKARIVPDLNRMPEFVRHCRPVGPGVQPGIVIRFPTYIEPGRNFFGLQIAAGDHNYSSANYATKIQTCGVWIDQYSAAGLSTSPRAYLVPVGNDYLRTSNSAMPVTRAWSVHEQRIPVPFTINQANLTSPGYIPTLNGIDGVFGEIRRHGDFRMYHDEGDPEAGDDDTITGNSRLIGRSVWNSEWLLIIPGANLHHDPNTGLEQFANTIADIKLYFLTYSHLGQ